MCFGANYVGLCAKSHFARLHIRFLGDYLDSFHLGTNRRTVVMILVNLNMNLLHLC